MGQFAEYGPGNYAPEEFLDDLTDMVFEELYKGRTTDSWRRYLQRTYVSTAIEVVGSRLAEGTDARTLLLGKLTELQKKTAKAKSSDAATRHPGPLDGSLQDDREGAEITRFLPLNAEGGPSPGPPSSFYPPFRGWCPPKWATIDTLRQSGRTKITG